VQVYHGLHSITIWINHAYARQFKRLSTIGILNIGFLNIGCNNLENSYGIKTKPKFNFKDK